MSPRWISGIGALAVAAALVAGLPAAQAQGGLWGISTNTCSTDGARCIKGIVKDSGPYATQDACQKAMEQLAKTYHDAHLNVMFIRCVQLKR
ncbi:MAG: hypothetical protein JO128_06950 [Alphaproteobacteria bacterium]|nr:hypothetical protein [Alphaproteobacteria bacterium]